MDKEAEKEITEFAEILYNFQPWGNIETLKHNIESFLLANHYIQLPQEKPRIICLCGSTRFTDEMLVKQWELTKRGFIVLSWCALPSWYFEGKDKSHIGDQESVKEVVDEIHKRKIDLADEIIIIRAGMATNGLTHIGESTYSEMSYAYSLGKPIKFSPPDEVLEENWNSPSPIRYMY